MMMLVFFLMVFMLLFFFVQSSKCRSGRHERGDPIFNVNFFVMEREKQRVRHTPISPNYIQFTTEAAIAPLTQGSPKKTTRYLR